MAERPPDEVFAQHLLKAGFVTEAELRSALQAQAESAAKGSPLSLGDMLVQQGLLTPALREKAEKKLESQREEAKRLGPYKVLRKLGEGGMGAVYLAEDTGTGEKVALKVLPKVATKDQDVVRRFLREVESARRLEHPNIVQAGAGGEDKGFHYYVMEYVAGETLGARIKREEFLPVEGATKFVLHVAYGLKYAHEQGYIHRDIKLENVIVTPEGVAKILDMGLSKNIDEARTFRTVTGVTLGTPHYMAPEQARGDKGIDGRADIYSLGVTYYHLVTGETPFHGTTAIELISQHMKKQLPDPRDIRDGIPDGVVHVIRRMMAKRPDDRYKDCGELITDLELVLGGRNPSSQELEAARSAVGLPMGREARERYRAQRRRGERPGTVRATTKPRTNRVPLMVGGICMAAVLILLLVLAFGGGSKPPQTDPVVVEEIKVALHESFASEREYQKDRLTSLQAEATRLKTWIDKAYADRLEGLITPEEFREKSSEWRSLQLEIQNEIRAHTVAEGSTWKRPSESWTWPSGRTRSTWRNRTTLPGGGWWTRSFRK
jgi:serine/threonine-protein kinase